MKNIWFTVFCFSCLLINAQITTFPYLEDFETGPAWTAFTAATSTNPASSDWAWGTPNHTYVIKTAGNGNKCWCAGGLSGAFYNNWEQSYVKSPVFNFTNLLYPHIKFKLFYDCEYHFDGGNLQYSINGGATWNDVGTVGGTAASPIPETNDCNTQNWYNYPSINYLNNPAGFVTSKHGWCGNTQNGGVGWDPASAGTNCVGGNGPGHWITAEHCLTGCAGQPNVILRFTFGSGFSCNNFDGLAFDSVGISNGVPNSADFISTCGLGNTISFTSTFAPCPQTNAWSWNFGDPSSGATNTVTTQNASHTFSGPGTYTVVLIAKGGACNPPDTITKVVQVLSAAVTSYTNVSCFGGTNGAAVATVSLGILPLTYAWSPSGGSATTAAGLAAGNYSFTVTDANGCQKTSTVAITQPPAIVASITPSNITCNGLANGTATLTASGGVAPLNYTWSPTGGNGITATALNAGNFTTTVTDANTCTKTVTFSITQPAAINTSVLSTDPLCAALGSATITASGGTGALSYSWSPMGGINNIASGLSGGNYSVSITDGNTCVKTQTLTLIQSSSFTTAITSSNVSCFGGNNGSATAVITGTSIPYTYTWSPVGGNMATANSLTAGNYTLSVNDVNGCAESSTVTIIQPTAVLSSITSATICSGQQATLTSTVSGGTAPYIYSWQPSGSTNASISVTPALTSSYTLNVIDNNNCNASPAISQITVLPPLGLSVTGPFTICANSTVAINASATGGNGNYQYTWLPGNLVGSSISSNIASNTQYTVIVNDGCTALPAQALTQVNVIPSPTINIHHTSISGCPTLCSTFYDSTLVASGIVSSWNWMFSDGQSSSSSSAYVCFTKSGVYSGTLIVTTNNGCTTTPSVLSNITVYIVPTPDFTSSTFDGNMFNAPFVLNNTSTNYNSIKWITTLGNFTSNSINLNYQDEGLYPVTLIATNNFGCKDSITKTIKVEPIFTFYAPNSFTPNDNGLNDTFLPMGTGWDPTSYTLLIFDRWGVQIFNTNDVNQGWDGTYKGLGEIVQVDVYTWKVDLKDVFHKQHNYIGHVTVLK